MSTFDEVRFPVEISFGSSGGPTRQTQIVIMGSGAEARNARWLNSRREYDIGYGLRSMNDLHTVIAFFEARNAQLIGFRFKDWTDYKSCGPDSTPSPIDQNIGTGSVTPLAFQLVKKYQSGSSFWTRTILKPVAGTTRIAVNGTEQFGNFTVDTTTGIVSFTSSPPGAGATVTAGYEFDTPVRFDSDKLTINMKEANAGNYPSIMLRELFSA